MGNCDCLSGIAVNNKYLDKKKKLLKDSDPRRLEYRTVLWNGENKSLGSPVFHSSDDFWKLCPIQSPCCNLS